MSNLPTIQEMATAKEDLADIHTAATGGAVNYQDSEGNQRPTLAKVMADINTEGSGWLALAQEASDFCGAAQIQVAADKLQVAADAALAQQARTEAQEVALDGQEALFYPFVVGLAEQALQQFTMNERLLELEVA